MHGLLSGIVDGINGNEEKRRAMKAVVLQPGFWSQMSRESLLVCVEALLTRPSQHYLPSS